MTIQIATGRGWFDKRWVENDTEYTLTIEDADVTLNRYGAVCIKVDSSDAVREAVPYVKYSEYATQPVKPTMERSETLKEYCLAYVYIKAGASEITASDIEDTRADESLCGWVTGLIEQLSSATLFSQFTAIFTEWFNGLRDLINENTETMLVNALPKSLSVTLSATGWVTGADGTYKQSVAVLEMTDTKSVMVQADERSRNNYSIAEVKCTGQSENALEFTAVIRPSSDLIVTVLHMGV